MPSIAEPPPTDSGTYCTVGSPFSDQCQRPAKYAATWTDNGDTGLLCEEHAASARALPNGPSLHLRTLDGWAIPEPQWVGLGRRWARCECGQEFLGRDLYAAHRQHYCPLRSAADKEGS